MSKLGGEIIKEEKKVENKGNFDPNKIEKWKSLLRQVDEEMDADPGDPTGDEERLIQNIHKMLVDVRVALTHLK